MSTVMVRAELTPDQWKELRKIAIDRGVAVQEMVGDLLVDFLHKNGYKHEAKS